MRIALAPALALLLASASCTSEEASAPSPAAPVRCRMPVGAPDGFTETASEDVPQGPTIGTRIFFEDPSKRYMAYTAGVLMDFFDNRTDAKFRMTDGSDAWLFEGSPSKWIFFWRQVDPCQQYSIGGQGFTRRAFLRQIRGLGLLPPD